MSGRTEFESDLILSMMINPLKNKQTNNNPQLIVFVNYIPVLMDVEQKAFSLWKSANQFHTLSQEISLLKKYKITWIRSISTQTPGWLRMYTHSKWILTDLFPNPQTMSLQRQHWLSLPWGAQDRPSWQGWDCPTENVWDLHSQHESLLKENPRVP